MIGALLRALLMCCLPYAVWGSDSRSYYTFAHKLLYHGWISLGDKRHYLYPLLLAPISMLPGGVLRWLPLIQHPIGLISLIPLAYIIRKTLSLWKLWIVPITVLYAGLPIVFWGEHELLGDTLFYMTFLWAFAGWVAWITEKRVARAHRLFWWFFVPFALFILTKPAGRFTWPGLLVCLCMVAAWRLLTRPQIAALLALAVVTPTVGSRSQGAWLLYTATFPLTRLDTPAHADYKAEIRDMIEKVRADIGVYYVVQHDYPFVFLREPGDQDERPLWKALDKDEKRKNKLYMDLAWEGIKSRPDLFFYLALQRVVFSSNLSSFDTGRFNDGYFVGSFAEYYEEAEQSEDSPIRIALALPTKGPIAPYQSVQRKFEPIPGSWVSRVLHAWAGAWGTNLDFFQFPNLPKMQCDFALVKIKPLGWWLFLGILVAFLPPYRRTLGVWMIISIGYIFGVFLVAAVQSRYVAPAWPIIFICLLLPLDFLFSTLRHRLRSQPQPLLGERC